VKKLHGWLKGVNTNTLVEGTDIGLDGQGDTDNPNRWFGRDAAGFSLGYYTGDYQSIGSGGDDFLNADLQNVYASGSDLFNGNISHMVTAIQQFNVSTGFEPVPQATTYRYDRLNRIKEMKAYQGTVIDGAWTAQNTEIYASAYKYDFNGNITELERHAGATQIDDLEYFYHHDNHTTKTGLASNKLYLVDEQSTHTGGDDLKQGSLTGAGFDPNDDATWNYDYDPIGNLIQDVNEGIDLISWTVTGKVSDVIFSSTKDDLTFRYDPMGNRIAKIQKPKNWVDEEEWTITWYARDAQGNVLAVYSKPEDSLNLRATEFNIYGSSRIGMVTQPEALTENPPDPVAHTQTLGYKVYEFSNHLGNVLTTFSDRKIAVENISDLGHVAWYTSEILSSTDYYPFGFQMPGRVYEADGYRYGFNSMEKDEDLKGSGNSYDFGARIYDPRVGRFSSIDFFSSKFAWNSTYCFAGNTPIAAIDLNGDSIYVVTNTGKVYNISSVNAADIKDKIGYDVLKRTASGKNLLEKYENSTTNDLYIGVGTTEDPTALAQCNREPISEVAGSEITNSYLGVKVRIKNTANVSFIIFNKNLLDRESDIYQKASVLFHEIKAHVDLVVATKQKIAELAKTKPNGVLSPTENDEAWTKYSHDLYGSIYSGYHGTDVKPNTPAAKIRAELNQEKKAQLIIKAAPKPDNSLPRDGVTRNPNPKPEPQIQVEPQRR
jgi:RHS repeat-associated protein